MGKIKDNLYYYFAEKNWGVRREYGPYVDEHREEHNNKRWKHWIMLIHLNIHYRIFRKKDWLYENREITKKLEPKINKNEIAYKKAESCSSKRISPLVLAQNLMKYDVISFDIFDTLVLRPIERPVDLFQLLEEKHKIFNFATLRKQSEDDLREKSEIERGHRDITINEIYADIEKKSGLDMNYGINVELETEIALCFANPYMKTVYDILVERGKKIYIVSDMYYPQDLMKKILNHCGYDNYDKLFVSCDYGQSKRRGELYETVLLEILDEESYCHVGDNQVSDIDSAEKYGIETYYYRNVHTIGRQFRPKDMSPLVKSFYSGTVNTHLHATEKVYSQQYEYGYIYAGIYALGYVNWIHEYSKQNNLDKVVFLARDSDILKTVYDMLYDDIPSEYMYWGRLPSFKYTFSRDLYGYIKRNIYDRINRKSIIKIGKLLDLLDISFLENKLSNYNLHQDDYLNEENAIFVQNLIIEHKKEISLAYQNEKEIAKKYMISLLNNAENIAIVDIGWKGTEPTAIKNLLEEEWGIAKKVHCLMAGSYGNNWNIQDGTFSVYMFSPLNNVNHLNFLKKNISYYTLIVEMFGRMNCQPRFKGFSLKDNNVNMHFETLLVENKADMKAIKQGMLDFIQDYLKHTENFKYLRNISGYDAYCPTRMIERKYGYLEKVFGNHKIELDAGDEYAGLRTFKQYFVDNNI